MIFQFEPNFKIYGFVKGAAEKPQREEKNEEGEKEQVGLEEASGVISLFVMKFILKGHPQKSCPFRIRNADWGVRNLPYPLEQESI